jgi:pimeloyl-ACP methyl ester carboxylesterase
MHVDVGTARVFFDVVGPKLVIDGERMAERATLIVMHGGPGFDHSTLRAFFDRFADTHQVIYIDHRGNGRSTGEPETWTLARWGDDVKAFCDALSIEKPVVYGNSFGGMVAMSYAARHPEHPARLILSSTAGRLRLAVTYAMMEARGGVEARAVAERFWTQPDEAAMNEYMAVCMPLYNPKPNPGEMAARKRALMRPAVSSHFILGEMRTMDLLGGLSRVTAPTLILAGVHDPITPLACSEEILAALPDGAAEMVVFDDAGHGVHRDDPDRAEAVLRRFLGDSPPP